MTFSIKVGFWVILCNMFLPEIDLTLLVCVVSGQFAAETGHHSNVFLLFFCFYFFLKRYKMLITITYC